MSINHLHDTETMHKFHWTYALTMLSNDFGIHASFVNRSRHDHRHRSHAFSGVFLRRTIYHGDCMRKVYRPPPLRSVTPTRGMALARHVVRAGF
jgi:hypothetical protein